LITPDAAAGRAGAIAGGLAGILGAHRVERDLSLAGSIRGEAFADRAGYALEIAALREVTVREAVARLVDDPAVREEVLQRMAGEEAFPDPWEGYRALYARRRNGYAAALTSARGKPSGDAVARLAKEFARAAAGDGAADERDARVGEAVAGEVFTAARWVCDEFRPTVVDPARLKAPFSVVICILTAGLALAVWAAYATAVEVPRWLSWWKDLPEMIWVVLGIPASLYAGIKGGVWRPFVLWVISLSLLALASSLGLKGSRRGD
jgi:hypothetical protein